MTDHYIEENGGRYIMHLADADGKMFTYYILFSGRLVRCDGDEE